MLLRAALPLVARRPLDEVCPSKGEVKDASVIAEEALPFLRWAQQWTRVSNPLVLVEFATQMAYDHAFRGQVMLTLGDAPPSLWWWSGGRQHCWPNPDGYFPPVLGNEVKKLLDKTTAFEKRHIPRVSAVSPFVGLPLRAIWSHDPVRPPVQALRLAAGLIRRQVGHESGRLRVLGVELGHSIGGQALSAFLPKGDVFTVSSFYDVPGRDTLHPPKVKGTGEDSSGVDIQLDLDGSSEADKLRLVEPFHGLVSGDDNYKADAVVLNLPSLRQAAFLMDIARRGRWGIPTPMTGQENDYCHQMKVTAAGDAWEHLVQYSLDRLSAHGLLVVLADVDCGVHHRVTPMLYAAGDLHPLKVTDDGGTVAQVEYTSGPPRRLGVIPATGRLISAWRRMP